jgi:hypothetical protein
VVPYHSLKLPLVLIEQVRHHPGSHLRVITGLPALLEFAEGGFRYISQLGRIDGWILLTQEEKEFFRLSRLGSDFVPAVDEVEIFALFSPFVHHDGDEDKKDEHEKKHSKNKPAHPIR